MGIYFVSGIVCEALHVLFLMTSYEGYIIVIAPLLRKKLRHRQWKWFSQGHIASTLKSSETKT